MSETYYEPVTHEDDQRGTTDAGAHPTNDALTLHAQGAGVWGDPSMPDHLQQPAHVPEEMFDYSAGMFVGVPGQEADAVPGTVHPTLVAKLASDGPRSYDALHEATHRRYDAPFSVSIAQAAAGYTLLSPPKMGLHYLKLLGAFITLSAAGTLKFVQGASDGTNVADLTGAIPLALNGGFVLATSRVETPWLFTAPDQGLGIVSATGLAAGWVLLCYSPYDA